MKMLADPALLLGLLVALTFTSWSARAATFEVTTIEDSGAGSLRQAILDANGSEDPTNTITFDAALIDGEILLSSPLPDVSQDLTIDGATAEGLSVRGADPNDRILRVATGTTALRDIGLNGGILQIALDARLTFDLETAQTIQDVITEEGSLEKRGSSTLTLLGTNDYSGGTLVSEGTLKGNTASLQGAINIVEDAKLVFEQEVDGTFGDVIRGGGSVEKTGEADLTLSAANEYTGGTVVSAGGLRGDTTSIRGPVRIAEGATVTFEQTEPNSAGIFTGAITGAGALVKEGPEKLTLQGSNDYSGGTRLLEGDLEGDTDSIPGDVQMAASTELTFNQTATGTHGGDISGEGALRKIGNGTLVLGGESTYTGGTTIESGVLQGDSASLTGQISNDAALVFDQRSSGSFNGVISGLGTVEKIGAGRLVLQRDQLYQGLTTVSSGRLDASGSLPADVRVGPAGTFGGTGSVGGDVTVEGVIAPGDGLGTLTVGSVSFELGSTLDVDLNQGGGGDLLDVKGDATIDGAGVRLALEPGAYTAPITIPILQATELSGDFSFLTPDAALLDESLVTDATSVSVALSSNASLLSDFARTRNQTAVALALENSEPRSDDLNTVFGNLNVLTAEQLADAYDQIGGEQLTGFANARLAIGSRFNHTLQSRIRGPSWGESSASIRHKALPSDGPDVALEMWDRGEALGGWMDGYAIAGALDGDSNSADVDYRIWGTSFGIDYRSSERWLFGLAGGYARTDLDLDHRSGEGDADTIHSALYGGYLTPRFHLGLTARYASTAIDTSRDLVFASINRRATADFDGYDFGIGMEATVNAYGSGAFTLQPLAAFDYLRIQQDGFSESGANSLNLAVEDETLSSVRSGLGARILGTFRMDERTSLTAELRARWNHEFGDRDRQIRARIQGSSGGAFTVLGAEPPRDSATLGASWGVTSAERLRIMADYNATLSEDLIDHSGGVGVRVVW